MNNSTHRKPANHEHRLASPSLELQAPPIVALAYRCGLALNRRVPSQKRFLCPDMALEPVEEAQRIRERFTSTVVIAASIIAAVRLARDENISGPSPRLMSVIADCVGLARLILERALVRKCG
ncbi:hypothetical protein [Granulicella sibirica]|nr:hypothetical protein [Granulicella sibirica]